MKFYVETFGCQMNAADSLEMARRLKARGFRYTKELSLADVALVNTCTVRQHAEQKALSYIGRLKEWKKAGEGRLIFLTGCAAERLKDRAGSRYPYVDWVAGAKSLPEFDRLLEERFPGMVFDGAKEWVDAWGWVEGLEGPTEEGPSGFLTIMRGCNFACSYCIVPAVRGREAYRPAASLLAEAGWRARHGQRELTLLGQTVNSYRPGEGGAVSDFADLLRAVARVPGVDRVRFMSPHPFYVNDRFIGAVAETPQVCPHIHLPVQSGSDKVLELMRRNYTGQDFAKKVERLREARPGLAVTTDWIVGFPGETEEDFEATLSLANELDLDGAYSFKYSSRPGTASAGWADDVPEAVKEDRHKRLLDLVDRQNRRKAAALAGTTQEVLVESRRKDGGWQCRTAHNRILIASGDARVGDLRAAHVKTVEGKTLYGSFGNNPGPLPPLRGRDSVGGNVSDADACHPPSRPSPSRGEGEKPNASSGNAHDSWVDTSFV